MKTKEEQKIYFDILKDFKETYIEHPENFSIDPATVTCTYRGDNGKKCAVGRYIPDSLYTPKFEEKMVDEIFDQIKEALPVDDLGFWQELQELHDSYAFQAKNLPRRLPNIRSIAQEYCPSYANEFTY